MSFGRPSHITSLPMCSMFARIVLALASATTLDASVDAEVQVMANPTTDRSMELERRLSEEVRRRLPYAPPAQGHAGSIVANIQIGPDGRIHVVNMHGGDHALREMVTVRMGDMQLDA